MTEKIIVEGVRMISLLVVMVVVLVFIVAVPDVEREDIE